MKNRIPTIVAMAALVAATPLSAQVAPDKSREAAFDAAISSDLQTAWLKDLSSAPNNVGSPHDKANAETVLALFKSFGWDARIETFKVLYPTPVSTTLEMITPARVTLGGQEPPVAGDPDTTNPVGALPPYVAYQGDGDVTAPVVYANYGMPADYEALARRGIDVKGKIVLTRYGGGWRGLKPKLAQEHGAIGCLIYSDPADDGYAVNDTYPRGGGRPPMGVQRGSVQDMTTYPGDPLTPGVGATDDARRLDRADAKTILKIPTLPISYADATKLLAGLEGPLVPADARGALPLAYHYGGTDAVKVHLAVKSDWSLKTLYDVIATLKGATRPDEWIVRGNHRDGWVYGAADPLSGQVAMLNEAKALGQLVRAGWKPQRTIVYASWDGEEPGLLGSTEWAETHADELKRKAVMYINTDENSRGFLHMSGSPELQRFANGAGDDVTDPETGASLSDRARAAILTSTRARPGEEDTLAAAKAGGDLPLSPLGSGSDYTGFLQYLGIASLNVGFGGEGQAGGSYHSLYDTFHHFTTFDDPGLKYGAALSKVVGRMVMRAADSPDTPARYADFATAITRYVGEIRKLASEQRTADLKLADLRKRGAFRLAADPLNPVAAPAEQPETPVIDLSALDASAKRLTASAAALDAILARRDLAPATRAKLAGLLRDVDQTLLDTGGLPFRPWFRNLVYAPGRFTGYGAKTLPGVREAIEERRFDDARAFVTKTAAVLDAYSARLDAAAALAQTR